MRDFEYTTIAVHKHPWASKYYGFGKGFNYFSPVTDPSRVKRLSNYPRSLAFKRHVKDVIKKEGGNIRWEGYYEEILKEIEKTKTPYFLWVFLLDTHLPYLPPREYKQWSEWTIHLLYLYWKLGKRKMLYNGKIPQVINAYDDEIYHSDFFIKRLWEDLKDSDPVFIIHSDHGDSFGHGFYSHMTNSLYEELIHIPLVIYNADVKGRIEKPVSLRGLSPTILELLGKENEFPADSFLNGGNDWVISKVFEGGKRKLADRMKDWTFIAGQNEKDELYYLKRDPHEQENLIDEHPDLAKEMRKVG